MSLQTKEKASEYLMNVNKSYILPNFWMSEEYIDKAELKWVEAPGGLSGFKTSQAESEDGEWFFPPLCEEGHFVWEQNIYSGFPNNFKLDTFLDYQFIYRPSDFLSLGGGKWKAFRKDVKKYMRELGGGAIVGYQTLQHGAYKQQVEELLLKWSANRVLYDPEVMIRFIMEGDNREALFVRGIIVGLNVFDQNFKFVNYRYCIDDGSSSLNILMRYLFYINQSPELLINDGGCLGSDSLYRFKNKLNPYIIHNVNSHKI